MIGEHNYTHYNVNKKLIREKVPVHSLLVGMYVVELDRPWIATPFLFQDFLISSEEEIVHRKSDRFKCRSRRSKWKTTSSQGNLHRWKVWNFPSRI